MIFNSSDNNMVPNFSIVSGTVEPVARTQNLIWIYTDYPIAGYAISKDEPTEVYGGLIWIKTGSEGNDTFSVFENDIVTVTPVSAILYHEHSDGDITSERVPVRRYTADGSYIEWGDGIIFNAEYDTYKWVTTAANTGGTAPVCGYGIWNETNCIHIGSTRGVSTSGTALTDIPVDLSNWNTLTATVPVLSSTSTTNTTLSLGVWTSISGSESSMVKGTSITYTVLSTGGRTINVDVSDLDGLHHIGFYFNHGNSTTISSATISEIRLS